MLELTLAVIVGALFGFVLQKAGAVDPHNIIGMLKLRNFHLMKAILFGIGLSNLLLFVGLQLGFVDANHLSVKSAYVGVAVGGGILGLGWAMAGFCPGTAVVAAGAGRKDALSFIAGGLLGAFAFTFLYDSIKDSVLFNPLGGEVTLALTGSEKYGALLTNVSPLLVAGGVGVTFIVIAFLLPSKR